MCSNNEAAFFLTSFPHPFALSLSHTWPILYQSPPRSATPPSRSRLAVGSKTHRSKPSCQRLSTKTANRPLSTYPWAKKPLPQFPSAETPTQASRYRTRGILATVPSRSTLSVTKTWRVRPSRPSSRGHSIFWSSASLSHHIWEEEDGWGRMIGLRFRYGGFVLRRLHCGL